MIVCFVFFFQAEDGIRDLVRSRGLGDVYKRQARLLVVTDVFLINAAFGMAYYLRYELQWLRDLDPVSYTHLTLPTSDLV